MAVVYVSGMRPAVGSLLIALALVPLGPSGCATSRSSPRSATSAAGTRASEILASVVGAPDRDAADRALDGMRRPADMLAFFGIRPGMRVAELGAGGGYTTELLARTVGPEGRVWAQNSQLILDRFAARPWSERLTKPVMRNVIRVDRPFDDPLPPDARDLDAVLIVLFYHDTVWMGVDRAAMNTAVWNALRPGGIYGIVDHSGRPGTGTTDVQTLHRIDESVVRREVEQRGFRLLREADFLRNPADLRDWNDSPRAAGDRRGRSDRFVLAFTKPS